MRLTKIIAACLIILSGTFYAQGVTFNSSDSVLNASFIWAKNMALSYAHQGDKVGDWYDASLPNREAFCMRDVSHQTMGAAVLGLYSHNKNMLQHFAEDISESRDWCSYWEINKYNKPAPVDYSNDNDFWYNLTSNFDVSDAIYRMYLWTGDKSYVQDPVFLNFIHYTLNYYRARWQLLSENIITRDRNINLYKNGNAETSKFKNARGIPGYNEGGKGELALGIDLLAAQAAALNDYYYIEAMNQNTGAAKWLKERDKLIGLINKYFFDKTTGRYYSCLYTNGQKDYSIIDESQACGHYLLYFGAENNKTRINTLLDELIQYKDKLEVESASHMPEIFFKYGRPEEGIYMIKRLTAPSMKRKEYPENSFSVIGAFANGLMGINPDASKNCITTLSNLVPSISYASISNVPVFSNSITVKHTGIVKTEFTNNSGNQIRWKASFKGNYSSLYVDGQKVKAAKSIDIMGNPVSSIVADVPAGKTITVGIK